MRTRNSALSGFSLVEVSLALAVVVFCLVTLLGLLTVGINSTHTSTIQTAATNILTAVASDLEATSNATPGMYSVSKNYWKGKMPATTASPIYGITIPATGAAVTPAASPIIVYIQENGQPTTKTSTTNPPLYQVDVWFRPATSTQQETFARLLVSWPATAAYTSAQGYVENVIAINRI
jgi:uncharacterized protein (TIGR02598 family)